jgi:hypothetical protein
MKHHTKFIFLKGENGMSIVVKIEIDGKEVGRYEVDQKKSPGESSAKSISQYARFFDESSEYWDKNPEISLMFLKHREACASAMLKNKGHLFLNEVYDMLGLPRTRAGALVGWVYDEKNPVGDNYVDFGIYNDHDGNRNFINGYERTILLDFNVDGEIFSVLRDKES